MFYSFLKTSEKSESDGKEAAEPVESMAVPSSATGLRRTSRAKVAKNNSEFIYYSKYKEIGSATSSNQPESASLPTKRASGKVSKARKSVNDACTAKQRSE